MSLELHPLCTLFPRLEGVEFESLKADIEANGQLQPIVLHDGMILDGGNRYRACVELGIEPLTSDMDLGDYDLLSYVLSVNLHRRHLTPGQHAAIVAAATDWLNSQTVGRPVNPATLPDSLGQAATLPLETVADRAARSGASERTQRMADKVAKADPDLVKRVAHGEISLPKAVRQIERKDQPEAGTTSDFSRHDSAQESSSESDYGPSPEEIAFLEQQERADREKYDALVEVSYADDKIAAALKLVDTQAQEIARLRAEIAVLRERQTGLMNEKVALESAAKRWKKIAEQHGYKDKGGK
ncbi:ParB N-terminal domain-containing protein [Paraburkholderia sp. BL25I1N1]|uniref:ParB N-terminal domain-containing protein n=1 Tax=Paraburkholderia sp. BL25I1N1 TaxID=1938804 RepID=UPI000D04DEEA|nr:ParB N-terminal domain-containing protein [Paraburkholderia sp. BL25I1N1]PRY07050.1 ParB-like nuclease family protein [Paraburkholderia sp. BL25I1N1]